MVKYYIIIGIIYTIPYIVTIVISGLRKKLETDRNFYGKTIDIQKIELTNVSYKKFEIARNNIKKYTEMGEIKYVYDRSYDFEDERLLLSEKEYQKCFPDKFVKTTVAYYIIFEFSYETDHGKIKAKITLTKPVKVTKDQGSMIGCFQTAVGIQKKPKREIGSYLFVLISTQIKEIQYFYPILRLEYWE